MPLVNLHFLTDSGNYSEPEHDSDGEFNIDYDKIKQDRKNINIEDSKMMFIYQSSEIQQMFCR